MNPLPAATLGGQWGVAIFMIVVASWILYHFLAPDSFKEWRSAGLVQAFFPVTLHPRARV